MHLLLPFCFFSTKCFSFAFAGAFSCAELLQFRFPLPNGDINSSELHPSAACKWWSSGVHGPRDIAFIPSTSTPALVVWRWWWILQAVWSSGLCWRLGPDWWLLLYCQWKHWKSSISNSPGSGDRQRGWCSLIIAILLLWRQLCVKERLLWLLACAHG